MKDMTPPRFPLPRRATGVTSHFVISGVSGRLVTAAVPGGEVTHVDLRIGKHGTTLAGLTDALSTAVSIGLCAGVPTTAFVDVLRHTRYVPAGETGDPSVPFATSLGDYLAQRLQDGRLDVVDRP